MGADELESSLGGMGSTHTEGKNGRIVLGYEIALARNQHGEGLAGIEVGKTGSTELLLDIACGKEVDGRCIEQGHQLGYNVVRLHIFLFYRHMNIHNYAINL